MGLWDVVVPEATINYVANPVFRDAVTVGWGLGGTGGAVAYETGKSRWLYGCAKLTAGSNNVYLEDGFMLSVPNGGSVTASAWVFRATAVSCMVELWNATSASTLANVTPTLTGVWEEVTVTWTNGTGSAKEVLVRLVNKAQDSASVVWFDGVQKELKAYATTLCFGDREGCEWMGTAHNSASRRSAESISGGRVRNLEDVLGLAVTASLGIGMPPVQLLSQGQALQPGALFRGVKVLPRALALALEAGGASRSNLHALRRELIEVLAPDRAAGVGEEEAGDVWWRYTGGSEAVEIRAAYAGGLELGSPARGFLEETSLQLLAHDPMFYGKEASQALDCRAAALAVNGIVSRDGGVWNDMDEGVNGTVNAILVGPDRKVYVGGAFTTAGSGPTTVNRIAMWNPSTEPWGAGTWSALGVTGVSGTVYALAMAPDGTLYVGGNFATAGGTTVNNVAKWNGSAWSALGTTGVNGIVYALAIGKDGELYAGGAFTTAAGTTVNRVAKWDGSTWSALGVTGVNGTVNALAVGPDGTLYAGGAFTTAAGTTVNYVAKWDGTAWSSMGGGMYSAASPNVSDLIVDEMGRVYAIGVFTTAGGNNASGAALWNGSSWSPLAGGFSDPAAVAPDVAAMMGGMLLVGSGNLADLANQQGMPMWNGSGWVQFDFTGYTTGAGATVTAMGVDPYGSNPILYIGHNVTADDLVTLSQVTTVTNNGTALAYPVIRIKASGATASLIRLENVRTGAALWLDYLLLAGEAIEIDLRPGKHQVISSFYGNVTGRVLLPSSDISGFYLLPGANGILGLIYEETGVTVTAMMWWRERFWSGDV